MNAQRPISLNPKADNLEAVRITYPPNHSRTRHWKIEPMRFIPHDGITKQRWQGPPAAGAGPEAVAPVAPPATHPGEPA